MDERAIEYCSLQYLNQWLEKDSNYCYVLANGNKEEKLQILKSAAGFYRIARNLPAKFDEGKGLVRYEPVLEIIDTVSPQDFSNNTISRIREIEKLLSKKYGGKSLLSLTTKFLWIKIKSPIIIYDSQARTAIGSENGDLESYYDAWKAAYKEKQKQIETACRKLSKLTLYTVNPNICTEYISEVSSKDWFYERVFDIYLWNKGN